MSQHRRAQAVHARKGRVPAKIGAYRQAALLGALQGPTELLPVSSSAHLRALPWLCGWELAEEDPERRKAFEVAVHAGAAVAILHSRGRPAAALRELDRRRVTVIVLGFAPAAAVGLLLERTIERRLGGPRSVATGLLAGSIAMIAADRRPASRPARDAGPRDGLALGLAQAAALVPGVSRNGATLAAARARGFTREAANELSAGVALPVIAGATLLKGIRLRARGVSREQARALAVGAGAALASALASARVIRRFERQRALWPYAAYRIALAIAVLLRAREDRTWGPDAGRSA